MTSIETLRAVHHPTRRRIVDYLYLNGPAQVGVLASALTEQVGSISHHLRMLQRVGVVVQANELSTDGRTSWWRLERQTFSWAVDDFAENPADRMVAKTAEKLNLDHHLSRLGAWRRRSEQSSEQWRRGAFSADILAHATPDELADLGRRLSRACQEWREEIETDDGQEREPVFVFSHGFPTQP